MRKIVITGSAGGIGQATRERLARDGHEVIGVDLRDAEVIADLSTAEGRAAMIDAVAAASGGRIDGLVAGAGITGPDPAQVVSINYFGAVATIAGLRPLLANGADPSAVAVSSNSSTAMTDLPEELVDACLGDDEAGARALAGGDPIVAYAASKLALARWARRTAVGPARARVRSRTLIWARGNLADMAARAFVPGKQASFKHTGRRSRQPARCLSPRPYGAQAGDFRYADGRNHGDRPG